MKTVSIRYKVLGAVAGIFLLLEVVCVWQSRTWLRHGKRAMEEGRSVEAFDAWRTAASWQAPFNPWRREALDQLSRYDEPAAWRRLRGAILESTMVPFGTEHDLLELSAERLASMSPGAPRYLWTGAGPGFSFWRLIAALFSFLFLGSGYGFIRTAAGTANRKTRFACLAIYLGSLMAVFLGLCLAA